MWYIFVLLPALVHAYRLRFYRLTDCTLPDRYSLDFMLILYLHDSVSTLCFIQHRYHANRFAKRDRLVRMSFLLKPFSLCIGYARIVNSNCAINFGIILAIWINPQYLSCPWAFYFTRRHRIRRQDNQVKANAIVKPFWKIFISDSRRCSACHDVLVGYYWNGYSLKNFGLCRGNFPEPIDNATPLWYTQPNQKQCWIGNLRCSYSKLRFEMRILIIN